MNKIEIGVKIEKLSEQKGSPLKTSIKLTNFQQDWQRKNIEDTNYEYQGWDEMKCHHSPCRHQKNINGIQQTPLNLANSPKTTHDENSPM